jgi:hypothetical protein
MPTDWRGLFDALNIRWTDRGPNARRGRVNIACPFCGDSDPSEHMMIWEDNSGYLCHRNQRHRGRSLDFLLQHVLPGTPRREISRLLNDYAVDAPIAYERPRASQSDVAVNWQRFQPAADSKRCLAYLARRGFPDPAAICRRYDLRFSPAGTWAGRLLIPIVGPDGEIATWTGRALIDELSPRYWTQAADNNTLYVPRQMRATMLVFEGPLDVLKVAAATEHMPVTPVGLLGLDINESKLYQLKQLLQRCTSYYLCFDNGVLQSEYRHLSASLAFWGKTLYKGRLRVPQGFDDPGEMPIPRITEWIAGTLS